MVCTCMVQIEFQFRYSFMSVIQEKETHAFTPKNGKFNSVEGRQYMKETHAFTSKNDESNSVEGPQSMKETHASTPKNGEFNSVEDRQ